MSFEQAKLQAKQLSAIAWRDYQTRRRVRKEEEWQREEECFSPLLPIDLTKKFIEKVLLGQVCWGEKSAHYRQLLIYWRTARRIIREVNLPPQEWSESPTSIYAYFKRRQWSLSYAQKVIRVMNLWGKFYCKSVKQYFELLAKPHGESSAKIHEAYFEKRPEGLVSAPITWRQLKRAKLNMRPGEWNWLFLTLWFGLRPSELKKLTFKIERYKGHDVLAVYQHKLVRLPPDQRWKFIPILFKEQERGVKMLERRAFREPSISTIQKYVNPKATKRGGRKGFVAHMWEVGKKPKILATRWLGHKNVRTTDNHYTQGLQQACEFRA
jgi:hypothetical protein